MATPWRTLDVVTTPEGDLELRQRGGDFLIAIGGRVLMTSAAHRSEEELARRACAAVAGRPRVRLLVGGLGMGYTLRAALDALPPTAELVVAELNPTVVTWCRGPLAPLTRDALADPRVTVRVADVAAVIREAPARFDAIVLDLYEGPNAATQTASDPCYGEAALRACRAALRPGGVLAIWSEDPDRVFEERFARAGFRVSRHRGGRGGRAHVVYLGARD
jgi:spermidine synthase